MSKKTLTENDCRDSKKVISFARHNGIEVREGKGSHFRMKYGQEYETAYHGEISDGVARKVFKFFSRAGLLCLVAIAIINIVN